MQTTAERHAEQMAVLHDPIAFARKLFSEIAESLLEPFLLANEPTSVAAFEAASDLVAQTAATGGDVKKALGHVSDAAFNMATGAQSRGEVFGVAAEAFRQAILAGIDATPASEQCNGWIADAIAEQHAKLRGEPAPAAA